jgi:hypothetical protein
LNGAIRTLAKAGVFGAKVTGIAAGTDLETTAHYTGGGRVTRQVRLEDKRGQVHEMAVTAYGWKVRRWIDAVTKMPLAVKVGPIDEHETHWTRALVTQARAHLAGGARLHKIVLDQGLGDGTDLWWLDHHHIIFVVPAQANMAVTADARAQAAAQEGITIGRRVHTVRHGQGRGARTERLETDVVGITGLPTDAQYGTPEHRRSHNRRDLQPHGLNAVVVRQWHGRDYGPGGKTVFLTNASVQQPRQPFDDDDDRRLIENCGMKEAKQPWELSHPPQKNERAVRVHGVFTLLMCALATAYRLPCAPEALGDESVGWRRWRRQLFEQTRDLVIIFAQGYYGIFPRAEYSLLVGVRIKDCPPGIGTRQEILAKYRLTPKA